MFYSDCVEQLNNLNTLTNNLQQHMHLLIRLFNEEKKSEDDQPVIDAGEHAKQRLEDSWEYMWTDDEADPSS